jgi:hypothetical protein
MRANYSDFGVNETPARLERVPLRVGLTIATGDR